MCREKKRERDREKEKERTALYVRTNLLIFKS